MSFVPNIDYALLETSTLSPLPLISGGTVYYYDFQTICTGSTATTTVSICNLTVSALTFTNVYIDAPQFNLPIITGITIPQYDCFEFDINFVPTLVGNFNGLWIGEMNDGLIYLLVHGFGRRKLLEFKTDFCFLNFGSKNLNTSTTQTAIIGNNSILPMIVTFSGNSGDFEFDSPITLLPGLNNVDFTFNPQSPVGDKTTFVILQGDCNDYLLKLCGSAIFGQGIGLNIDVHSTYVDCCNNVTLYISNNFVYGNNIPITITNIGYPNYLIPETFSVPFILQKGDCYDLTFSFCPQQSGFTASSITVDYTIEITETTYSGTSEINFILSGFTHPFDLIDTNCLNFTCINTTYEAFIPITNNNNQPLEINYFFDPNNGYDLNTVFNINPPPLIIPPETTTGLTISVNTSALTSGTSFGGVFYLNLVDVNCCIDKKKCINVNFCPTTVIPDYGYPKNVMCYGNCTGEMSFTINNCGNECITGVLWSSDTRYMSLITEFNDCRLLFENGNCIGEEEDFWVNSYTGLSANNLPAGNYLLLVSGGCCNLVTYPFTITEPDQLYLEITWTNPRNYCMDNVPQLCGIVPSPNVNPSGYVVIDKETLIKVVNNDIHNIKGQTKRGYQQYDARENEISHGNAVDPLNSFRNYILNFFAGAFDKYKHKWVKEDVLTVKAWDEIVNETIGDGCCFASFVSGGTPPYSYQWYGPNGYTSNSPNIFDRPCCEEYTLVITDANGCTITGTSTCLQCEFGISNLYVVNPSCQYSSDGFVDLSITGNCPSSIYSIILRSDTNEYYYTGDSTTFTGLIADDYTLSIQDLTSECYLDPIVITLIPKYLFTISESITGTTCLQSCDGRVEVFVDVIRNQDSIIDSFAYDLDGNTQRDTIFTGICSGNHELIVTNTLNNCDVSTIINVPNLYLFDVSTFVIDASSKDESDGTITIVVTNGISLCPSYECYDLSGDTFGGLTEFTNGSYTISNLKPGTYNFILTDNNGCSKIFKVKVGYVKTKRPKGELFSYGRTDVTGGSKITSNVPKGQ